MAELQASKKNPIQYGSAFIYKNIWHKFLCMCENKEQFLVVFNV